MAYTLFKLKDGKLIFIDRKTGNVKKAAILDDETLTQEEWREVIVLMSNEEEKNGKNK